MMPDLVDEHMRDDGAQRFAVLRPIIEDRAPVEEDHVGHGGGLGTALREAHALKEAEDFVFGLGLHLFEDVIFGKIVDPDDDLAAESTKGCRQALKDVSRQSLEIGKTRRFEGR